MSEAPESAPAFSYLPEDSEQEWLLSELTTLIDQRGAGPFLRAPILEPSSAFFPDRFTADVEGVRTLADRILGYAGLTELRADVTTFENESPEDVEHDGRSVHRAHHGAAAWFAGIQDGACRFGVVTANLHEPELLVASLCHEVAHAYRAHHDLVRANRDEEEVLTDLTTIYLGFGILTVNGTEQHRSSGDIRHYAVQHHALGYLTLPAMSFLLAAQAFCRELSWSGWRRIIKQLGTNQAACFAAATKALRMNLGPVLRSMVRDLDLRAGPPSRPRVPVLTPPVEPREEAPPTPEPPEPLEFPTDLQLAADAEPPEPPPHSVFLVRPGRLRGSFPSVMGGLAGLVLIFERAYLMALILLVPSVLLGIRGWRRHDDPFGTCSDPGCRARIEVGSQRCPGCGGIVRGIIRSAEDRLNALAALEPEDDGYEDKDHEEAREAQDNQADGDGAEERSQR